MYRLKNIINGHITYYKKKTEKRKDVRLMLGKYIYVTAYPF